ncbi:bifunctional cytochrome P450/NADPH--P450 reductase [Paenibacillus glucanolyticus]
MTTIPQPKTFGPLGNLPLIDRDKPIQSFVKLADEFGPIFRFDLPNGSAIFISGPDLVADACDQSRFDKFLAPVLKESRKVAGDALFTAETQEPNWQKAHQILLPSFSQSAMRGYHDMMVDIAVQLIQKWARLNEDESVDVPEDMTRLTLDTIGLCGFNYRFNSFYRDLPHPFIQSMVRSLSETMSRVQRMSIQNKLMIINNMQFNKDKQTMYSLVDKIISERRASGQQDEGDLLSRMLYSVDPVTGEKLDDENIRYQIITFLIAGHETTSGALSFAIYYLLKNPDKLKKAYEEVDRVLPEPAPSYSQVRDLKYIRMILNEALRLWPTAPAFSLYAKEDTSLAGKYPMKQGDKVTVLIPHLHRSTVAWGDDADEFRPERFEDFSKIPHHAYKPFGNGQRACIGQQFALHEATLVLGMVLKQFEIIDHTDYQLEIKESLTLKPDDFTIRVRPRGGQINLSFSAVPTAETSVQPKTSKVTPTIEAHNTPLLVLYGSDMGTAEGIARDLAETARLQGFISDVMPLNNRIGKLPKEGLVFIVSASYNGKPPINAREFTQWLESVDSGQLEGVRYAVFGCGDRTWASTYQSVPRFIDEQLEAKGAKRITLRGEADASGDFELQVEAWGDKIWTESFKALNLGLESRDVAEREKSTLSIQFVSGLVGAPITASYNAFLASVKENRELQAEGSDRSTRHIEITLPQDVSYQEGDHLGVIPQNESALVERVLRRYGLNSSDYIVISASGRSVAHLPVDRPISVHDLLSQCVELQEAATRAQLRELAAFTVCPPHKKELEALLQEDAYKEHVLNKRLTMLDLLERYMACELPFERFVELLQPLKPRYYSISSSPSIQNDVLSISVGVVRGPAKSGNGEYRGVASNYLASLQPGNKVMVFVNTPESGFTLPEQPETPIVMVGPGTGFAPFRGFLQARQTMKSEGKTLGEAHLYYGCRNELDHIYREEVEQFERQDIVTVHTAYSRKEGMPKTYVQHLMKENSNEIIRMLGNNGKLYICGDGSRMAPDVEACLKEAYQEVHAVSKQEAQKWLEQLQSEGRYAKDVWAGN